MNQTAYRNWIRTSFIPAVQAVVNFHGATSRPITTRELAKEIRLVAANTDYLDPATHLHVHSAQALYRKLPTDYFFFEYGDRLTRALNAAVNLGLFKRELVQIIRTKNYSYRTGENVARHIYKYQINS